MPGVFVERLRTSPDSCLPRELIADTVGADAGRVPCWIVELSLLAADCVCAATRGRAPAEAALDQAVRARAAESGFCGSDGGADCEAACACQILQLSGAGLDSCQNDEMVAESLYGFCYVDAGADLGNPELVADCPDGQRRRLRFVGADTPAPSAAAFIACAGAPLSPEP